MRKVGYFFLIFLPFVLAEVIQIVAAIYSIVLGLILSFFTDSQPDNTIDSVTNLLNDTNFNMMMMIFYALISIFIFGIWYYVKYEADYLPIRHHGFKSQGLICIAGIAVLVPGAQFASSIVCSGVALVSPDTFKKYEDLLETAGLDSITPLVLIYSVIMAPLCEELIFRGVTFSCAKRLFPFWLANIIQAALFGLFHMNIVQGLYAFLLGLLLGYVCEKGKSIYFSLILHFLFNLWGTCISLLFQDMSDTVLNIIIAVGMPISLVGGLTLFIIGFRKSDSEAANPMMPS